MVQWSSRSLTRDPSRAAAGFIETCQPVPSGVVPYGPEWIHELKYDGWRILARKNGDRVHLWSRNARDWTRAFPPIAQAIAALPLETCVLDGEAIAPGEDGWPKFHALRSAMDRGTATLMVFDLLQVGLRDLRAWPLIERRAWLEDILKRAQQALHYSEAMKDGAALYRHACALNLEGVVSKKKASPYRSGQFDGWRKIKCPNYSRS
jgi:bifunctional non-homologous end joining protein LigD